MTSQSAGQAISRRAEPTSASPQAWLAVALVVLAVVLLRVRMLEFPLERDEGEYAYAGQLILEGVLPYDQVYNMKLPGTYLAYAAIMAIFGQTTAGIHAGLILVNAATIVLMFLLGRRLFDATTGVLGCTAYGLMSTSEGVLGLSAHATHFVTLFAVAGIFVLLGAGESGRCRSYFLAGLLLGVSLLMKQHAVFLCLFGLVYAAEREGRRSPRAWPAIVGRVVAYGSGVTIPFLATCLFFAVAGIFGAFWFWTVTYAREYVSQVSWMEARQAFLFAVELLVSWAVMLWVLAGLGLWEVWRDAAHRQRALFMTGWLVGSFLAVCPGFYFRPHYFIVMLPPVAILAAASVTLLAQSLRWQRLTGRAARPLAMLIFGVAVAWSIFAQWSYFFTLSPDQVCYKVYKRGDLFVESAEVAKYLRQHADPDGRLAVLGSEPELFFYTHLKSATGYIYMYPLEENHPFALTMQNELMANVETERPEYLIAANPPRSVMTQYGLGSKFETWIQEYVPQHYQLVGLCETKDGATTYLWGDDAVERRKQDGPDAQEVGFYTMEIYRRKDAAAKDAAGDE